MAAHAKLGANARSCPRETKATACKGDADATRLRKAHQKHVWVVQHSCGSPNEANFAKIIAKISLPDNRIKQKTDSN